jgi:hypothetical protein
MSDKHAKEGFMKDTANETFSEDCASILADEFVEQRNGDAAIIMRDMIPKFGKKAALSAIVSALIDEIPE